MAGHPYVGQIADAPTQNALNAAWATINALQARITQLETTAPASSGLNAKGGRIVAVADPQAATDAVNLQTVRNIIQAQVGSF